MKTNIHIAFIFCLLVAGIAQAQNPAPGKPQKGTVLIMNAKAHLGNGKVIENSAIAFSEGKISLVADAGMIRIDKRKYDTVIDAGGKHVYPGLIACNTNLGLTEIDLVRSTRDFQEVGTLNPNVRSIIAYNTDSKIIPTVRSNGVLLAEIVPQGGILSGQSSVVNLDAWNWEDAAYKTDIGIHLNWPGMYTYRYGNAEAEEKAKQNMKKQLADLEILFDEAASYAKSGAQSEKNLRLEAMKGLFDGSKKLFIHTNYVKEIAAAVDFCQRHKVQMVLVGGADAWRLSELLKANDIPVIISGTHNLPSRDDEDTDLPYKLPYLLKKDGVSFAISAEGSWQVRNLMFQAGTGEAYGLSPEEALASITSSPAKILGIFDRTGTIEEGKDATLFISDGDILDMRSNNVVQAFICGRNVNLDNIQKQLYQKYNEKYGLK